MDNFFCANCRHCTKNDWHELVCGNESSRWHGDITDEDDVCEQWAGDDNNEDT